MNRLPYLDGDAPNPHLIVRDIPHRDLAETVAVAIAQLKAEFWDYPLDSHIRWLRDVPAVVDRHITLWANQWLVGYLRLAWRTGHDGTCDFPVAGIGTVCVTRALRGQGIGKRLMQFTNELIDSDCSLGLLCCQAGTVPFYESVGWTVHPGPFRRADSGADFFGRLIPMAYPASVALNPPLVIDGDIF